MAELDAVQRTLGALSNYFIGGATFEQTLTRVVELSEEAVPHSAMTGITTLVDGRPATAAFTHPEAPEIDTAQYGTGSGPCLEAFKTQQVLIIQDTRDDDRWPEFCHLAFDHGVRSTMSLPLAVNDEPTGALNFYAMTPSAFDQQAVDAGGQFAVAASIVLANANAYWDARNLSEQLSEAMQSRATIEQAKGVIMGQSGVPADVAFEMLVRASQRENRKLREVADEIVSRAHRSDNLDRT